MRQNMESVFDCAAPRHVTIHDVTFPGHRPLGTSWRGNTTRTKPPPRIEWLALEYQQRPRNRPAQAMHGIPSQCDAQIGPVAVAGPETVAAAELAQSAQASQTWPAVPVPGLAACVRWLYATHPMLVCSGSWRSAKGAVSAMS